MSIIAWDAFVMANVCKVTAVGKVVIAHIVSAVVGPLLRMLAKTSEIRRMWRHIDPFVVYFDGIYPLGRDLISLELFVIVVCPSGKFLGRGHVAKGENCIDCRAM